MAENQDNSTKSDEQKLADLEKQLTDKPVEKKLPGGSAIKEIVVDPSSPAASDTSKKATATEKSTATESGKGDTSEAKTGAEEPSKAVKPAEKSVNAPVSGSKNPTENPKKSEKKTKTGLLWLVTLINLIVLILVVVAVYWGWQQWQVQVQDLEDQKQQQLAQQQEQSAFFTSQQKIVEQTVASGQFDKEGLERQGRALESNIESLEEQIQITAEQVQANKYNMSELTGKRPSDWLIAEADFLVRMAGRKLWLEHDEKTAIFMLQSADIRLQDVNDPSLLPVRQKLAVDIQAVQQINPVSYSAIALSISGMIPQIDNLALAFFKRPDINEPVGDVSESVDDWQTNLSNNMKEVTKNFFSYKKISTEIKPFMSDQQQWLSKEQLKFTLMTARIAILKEDTQLFKTTMQAALNILNEYFDKQSEAVIQFNNSLTEILDTDIQRVYPERFLVTNSLKYLIDDRLNNRVSDGDQ